MARTLGTAIRARRIELGFTLENLAVRIDGGMRQAEISRLEMDRVTPPPRERLERIARALELSVGDLLGRAGWVGANATLMTQPESRDDNQQERPGPSHDQSAALRDQRQAWGD